MTDAIQCWPHILPHDEAALAIACNILHYQQYDKQIAVGSWGKCPLIWP